MLGLEFNGVDTAEILSSVLLFAIVNVFFSLHLSNKCAELKRKNRKLEQSLTDPVKHVKDYFDDQFFATKDLQREPEAGAIRNPMTKEAIALRSAYLKIERKALERPPYGDSFWLFLNDNLIKLLKIVVPGTLSREADIRLMEEKVALMKQRIEKLSGKSDDEGAVQRQQKALQLLDEFAGRYRAARADQNRFSGYVDKMEEVVALFEHPERRRAHLAQRRQQSFVDSSRGHLQSLQASTKTNSAHLAAIDDRTGSGEQAHQIQQQLLNFKEENARLNQYVAQLKTELKKFERRLDGAEIEGLSQGSLQHPAENGQELSEALLEANEKEIDRLRGVISNQRQALMGMEENLKNMETIDRTQHDARNQQDIQMLRRNIAEAEICIQMLEQELETLRSDLGELRAAPPAATATVTGSEVEGLIVELEAVKTQLSQAVDRGDRQEQLVNFVREALTASSVEDLSLLLYDCVTALQWDPSLVIIVPGRAIDLTSGPALSAREKLAIGSMQVNEINPGEGGKVRLRLLHVSGYIKPTVVNAASEPDQRAVVQLLQTADRLIEQFMLVQKSRRTHKTLETCANGIKQTAYEVDKMLEAHTARTKVLLTSSIDQIQDMARAKGLNASHIAAYHAVKQEGLKQLEADSSIRLKSRKKFLALLDELETSG